VGIIENVANIFHAILKTSKKTSLTEKAFRLSQEYYQY
jgi:hypothetical protein